MKILQKFLGSAIKWQTSQVYGLTITSFQKSKSLGADLAFKDRLRRKRKRKGNGKSYSFLKIIIVEIHGIMLPEVNRCVSNVVAP